MSSPFSNSFLIRSASGLMWVEALRSGLMRQPIKYISPPLIIT